MNTIDVLDNGHVHLVDHMGSDLTVVNSARVSFANESEWVEDDGDEWVLSDKDEKLVRYLAKHNHWTPFAHPQITFCVKAPIPIRVQFFKHKQGFVENEISRRYVTFEPEFYKPKWRGKPEGNAKQGSDKFIEDKVTKSIADMLYGRAVHQSLKSYNSLIDRGIAPEQARFVLPQGMYTEWYWTGSLAAYARFYKQRIDKNAQWEVQQYADAIGKIIEPLFPVSWKCLTSQNDK